MKTKSLPPMVLASLLAVALQVSLPTARAITLAEFTGGQDSIEAFHGQSFTAWPGSAATNIVFNFFSDVPATNPVAQGTGFLFSQEYPGAPATLNPFMPGFLGQAVGDGDFYSFGPVIVLQPNTQYFLYTNASFDASRSITDNYSAGQEYLASTRISTFGPIGGDLNFRVTGTPVNGVPESGCSILFLGLSTLAVVALHRRSAIACYQQ